MKNQIKQALVDYLTRDGVDGYGQIQVLQPSSVFGDKTAEVLEWNKTNKLIGICTYGSRWGNYEGFSVSSINDEEIKKACYEARENNEVYRRAMTSW